MNDSNNVLCVSNKIQFYFLPDKGLDLAFEIICKEWLIQTRLLSLVFHNLEFPIQVNNIVLESSNRPSSLQCSIIILNYVTFRHSSIFIFLLYSFARKTGCFFLPFKEVYLPQRYFNRIGCDSTETLEIILDITPVINTLFISYLLNNNCFKFCRKDTLATLIEDGFHAFVSSINNFLIYPKTLINILNVIGRLKLRSSSFVTSRAPNSWRNRMEPPETFHSRDGCRALWRISCHEHSYLSKLWTRS